MDTTTSAVRTLLVSRVPRDGQRGEALISMTVEMTASALRGTKAKALSSIRDDVQKAVLASTGCRVERTIMDDPRERFTRVAYGADYADSLAFRLRERHWPLLESGLVKAYGNAWGSAKDEVWNALLTDARPSGLTAWTDANEAPQNTPGENLLTALFYFVSFATLGDGNGMESLVNLVRLLPSVVPIGEWRHGSGHWLVALR